MKKIFQNKESYSQTVSIQTTKKSIFAALTTGIDQWWGEVDHPGQADGDIFKVSWGEPWYQFKIIEFVPNSKVTWECVDANQIIGGMEGIEKEWVGSKLFWEIISVEEDRIQLNLLHEGLVPTLLCYEVCSSTWDRFITSSLKNYLEKINDEKQKNE